VKISVRDFSLVSVVKALIGRTGSGSGRSEEFVRQGVLISVNEDKPCGLDRIELERMDRLRNGEDEQRIMDG